MAEIYTLCIVLCDDVYFKLLDDFKKAQTVKGKNLSAEKAPKKLTDENLQPSTLQKIIKQTLPTKRKQKQKEKENKPLHTKQALKQTANI